MRLALALKDLGHTVALACSDDSGSTSTGQISTGVLESVPVYWIGVDRVASSCRESLFPPSTRGSLARVTSQFAPDIIHIQHLRWLGLHALEGISGIRLVGTLHDHWALCARDGQLLTRDGAPCEGPDPSRCAACLVGYQFGLSPLEARVRRVLRLFKISHSGAIGRVIRRLGLWRRGAMQAPRGPDSFDLKSRNAAFLDYSRRVDRWIAPSEHVAASHRAFGFDATTITVVPHGVDGDAGANHVPREGGPLRVAYLGTVAPQKGVHVLIEAARRLPPGLIRLAVHGRMDLRPEYASSLAAGGLPRDVTLHGTFTPGDAASILRQSDVVVVPSIWPENHPLAVAEALAARVPVVASNLGGIPELVVDGCNGRLVPPNDPGALADVLHELARDTAYLLRLKAGIISPMSFKDHAKRVVLAYDMDEESLHVRI